MSSRCIHVEYKHAFELHNEVNFLFYWKTWCCKSTCYNQTSYSGVKVAGRVMTLWYFDGKKLRHFQKYRQIIRLFLSSPTDVSWHWRQINILSWMQSRLFSGGIFCGMMVSPRRGRLLKGIVSRTIHRSFTHIMCNTTTDYLIISNNSLYIVVVRTAGVE